MYIYVATYIVAILYDMFHYIMIMNLTKLIYQVLSHSVLYVMHIYDCYFTCIYTAVLVLHVTVYRSLVIYSYVVS